MDPKKSKINLTRTLLGLGFGIPSLKYNKELKESGLGKEHRIQLRF